MEKENPLYKVKLDKVVLGVGGIGEELEKGYKLLKLVTGRTPARMRSQKRIPSLGVRPKLEVGAVVTIRNGKEEILEGVCGAPFGSARRCNRSRSFADDPGWWVCTS